MGLSFSNAPAQIHDKFITLPNCTQDKGFEQFSITSTVIQNSVWMVKPIRNEYCVFFFHFFAKKCSKRGPKHNKSSVRGQGPPEMTQVTYICLKRVYQSIFEGFYVIASSGAPKIDRKSLKNAKNARYRAWGSSKHHFFAFLTSPIDSSSKNTAGRGAPPREMYHVDKKKYS